MAAYFRIFRKRTPWPCDRPNLGGRAIGASDGSGKRRTNSTAGSDALKLDSFGCATARLHERAPLLEL